MRRHLLLIVRFHGDCHGTARFHGMGQGGQEWPPAPARLFQALVAGIARGGKLPEESLPALRWLESLDAPIIAVPSRRSGQSVSLFVPNNDADSLADPRDISSIRTKKMVHPSLFSGESEFLYAWSFDEGETYADLISAVVQEVYQLGRGVDPAWASGEVLDSDVLEERLARYSGVILHPGAENTEKRLSCPVTGSLTSLIRRHTATRLRTEGEGRKARTLFANAPKPIFRTVSYGAISKKVLFELRDRVEDKPWPWAQDTVASFVETLRDAAVVRFKAALPEYGDQIEAILVGRKESPTPVSQRVRILPLPSIGSVHVDRGIRRFLLEIPGETPLPSENLEWAFSGLEREDASTGKPSPFVVVRSEDWGMFQRHYQGPKNCWRSVTPLVLPDSAARCRIEPKRIHNEAKGGPERIVEEQRVVSSVHQALRHAGVQGVAVDIRVQREPFDAKGRRAEDFAEGTRFAKDRLWHVEITFDRPVTGPLVIGDGRFLGLGLMAPINVTPEWHAFSIEGGLEKDASSLQVAQAMRRAVMARVQSVIGEQKDLPAFFTGHERNGQPLRSGGKSHLAFAADLQRRRIYVFAPHLLDNRRPVGREWDNLRKLDAAVTGLSDLRAGTSGLLRLSRRGSLSGDNLLLASSQTWTSITDYEPTRYAKKTLIVDSIINDIRAEISRRGMILPESIEVLSHLEGPKGGIRAKVKLVFKTAVKGPILLGRTCHLGGGLFAPSP